MHEIIDRQRVWTFIDADYLGFRRSGTLGQYFKLALGLTFGALLGWAVAVALYAGVIYVSQFRIPFMTVTWFHAIWAVFGLSVLSMLVHALLCQLPGFHLHEVRTKAARWAEQSPAAALRKVGNIHLWGRGAGSSLNIVAIGLILVFPMIVTVGRVYQAEGELFAFAKASWLLIFEALSFGFYQADFPPIENQQSGMFDIFRLCAKVLILLAILQSVQRQLIKFQGHYTCTGNIFFAGKFLIAKLGADAFEDEAVAVVRTNIDEDRPSSGELLTAAAFRESVRDAFQRLEKDRRAAADGMADLAAPALEHVE